MSAAQYRRGSAALSRDFDREIAASGVMARTDRAAERDQRARLLERIAMLEAERDAERARARRLVGVLLRSRAAARKRASRWHATALRFKRLLDAADRNRAWMGGLIRALLTPAQVQAYRDAA